MICASLNSAVFIKNLLRYLAEKIRLLNTTNFRGDYPGAQRAEIKGFAKLVGGSIIIRPLAFDLDIGFTSSKLKFLFQHEFIICELALSGMVIPPKISGVQK